jgi:hypothetical protein
MSIPTILCWSNPIISRPHSRTSQQPLLLSLVQIVCVKGVRGAPSLPPRADGLLEYCRLQSGRMGLTSEIESHSILHEAQTEGLGGRVACCVSRDV